MKSTGEGEGFYRMTHRADINWLKLSMQLDNTSGDLILYIIILHLNVHKFVRCSCSRRHNNTDGSGGGSSNSSNIISIILYSK